MCLLSPSLGAYLLLIVPAYALYKIGSFAMPYCCGGRRASESEDAAEPSAQEKKRQAKKEKAKERVKYVKY